ncbi:GIY-YIG nuclease family protein [Candidatus Sororendozoicomonas aggregata]|uniref:GIY-YIG nuclease family protein n=1 Tax=Candidatus Sororendozoicomonas aggregata TaxID=3073239 RepID=UPI002ED33851
MWFVYMLLASDQSIYTGITTNITRRWQEHTAGRAGAKFFRGREPVYLLYLEASHNRSTATKKEMALKKLSRAQKWQYITRTGDLNKVHGIEHGLPVYSWDNK